MNNGPVVRQMVFKDFALNRSAMIVTVAIGAAALATLLFRRVPVTVVGSVLFFIALILLCSLLPVSNILNERKKQTLPFIMSLPITIRQYTTAKLLGTVVMFLIPWSALALAAVWLIGVRGVLPHGAIPMAIILLMLPFVSLSLTTALTLVGETEGWNMLANIICNSSYGLGWYFISMSPSLMSGIQGNVPLWNSARLTFLACEIGSIVLILAVTYYLQSRKRDFV